MHIINCILIRVLDDLATTYQQKKLKITKTTNVNYACIHDMHTHMHITHPFMTWAHAMVLHTHVTNT